jgi:hypothetical protein
MVTMDNKPPKTEPFSVRLIQYDKDRLDNYAIGNNVSRTLVVRQVIRENLDTIESRY